MGERSPEYEYIVVGSGAGGIVAARLAEAGHTVLLLEAGGDAKRLQGGGPVSPGRLPEDYDVPTFHPMSTENDAMKWDFFVRHYTDPIQQAKDDKFCTKRDGVWYPRAGTLGGCTAHNAMIMVYPHNSDWDHIAETTGDRSWCARNMRRYFQRLENCRHRWPYRLLYRLTGWNPTRHGFSGWLSIEKSIPKASLKDADLVKIIKRTVLNRLWDRAGLFDRLGWAFKSQGDPNDWRVVTKNAVGLHYAPIHTHRHARNSTREFVLDVARKYPNRLTIELNALATEVLFDSANRAIGVAYLKGERLYHASPVPSTERGEQRAVYVSREVILAGGAFNTPQLLMLSGIGPKDQLQQHNIKVRVDLPGVGTNLQDRYEVGVVNKLKHDWTILKDATFTRDDPQCRQWARWRKGVYTTNGAALAIIKRSLETRRWPDLFIFALIGKFKGYFPGYSKLIADNPNYLTWCILKAHTENRSGTVQLRSADPRDTPAINFHYFQEGSDEARDDLQSVVEGVKFVRTLTATVSGVIEVEELPGIQYKSDDEVAEFVAANAWGHHASCTCPIGPHTNPMAVLDSNFRVYGTDNLRVVDASVFPRIPGFFIASCVYMIAEKASDAILISAGHAKLPSCIYGEGFWCRLGRGAGCLGRATAGTGQALKPIGKALLGVLGLLVVALIATAAASWIIFEPPASEPDLNREMALFGPTAKLLIANLPARDPSSAAVARLKGNACVRADVMIDKTLPSQLAIGFLNGKPNGEKSYKAWMRFSNVDGRAATDIDGGIPAMAIKMLDVSGDRLPEPGHEDNSQDLLFIGHEAYFAADPRQYHDFFAACTKGGGSCSAMKNPYVAWHMLTHPRGAYNLFAGRRARSNIADISWFGVMPSDFGGRFAKFGAFPCEPPTNYNMPGRSPSYLIERLQNVLDPTNNRHVCFDLKLQTDSRPDSQRLENALEAWDSSWQQVARIDVPPQIFSTTAQQELCERLSFNPWQGLKAHRPVGGINRMRRDVIPAVEEAWLKSNRWTRLGSHELTGSDALK